MIALISSELERIWNRSKTKFLFVFTVFSTLGVSLFLKTMGIGFYNYEATAVLNSLNFSVFVLREIHLLLLFIVLPIIYIDCLNVETTNGSYRLIMLRPYHKFEFLIGKWIALILTTSVFLVSIFLLSMLFGNLFLPSVSYTTFYNINKIYTRFPALLYTIQFYFLEWIILMSLLSISSIISSFIHNAILSVTAVLGAMIGSLYISKDTFYFFLKSAEYIFSVLSKMISPTSLILLFVIIITGLISSLWMWQNKDLLY